MILSILWLSFAVFLSLQNGNGTGELSRELTRWLVKLFSRVGLSIEFEAFHLALRTAAHVVVFWVMGVLLAWVLSAWGATRFWQVFLLLAVVTVIAVMVEVGKLWIPGRHLQWDEVQLNVIGAWSGIGIWQLGRAAARTIKTK